MTVRNPIVLVSGEFQELPSGDSIGGAAQGPVGMTFQNTWSSVTSYQQNDVVFYNGSSYIALQANTNQTPPAPSAGATAYWNYIAWQGSTGPTGPTGPTGATGTAGSGYTLLQEIIVAGTSTSTFSFTSISQAFRTLKLFLYGRLISSSADSSNVSVQLNGDTTAANYSTTQNLGAQNATTNVNTTAASTLGGVGPILSGTLSGGSVVDAWEMTIVGYSDTVFPKVVTSIGGGRDGGFARFMNRSFIYTPTTAISSVLLTAASPMLAGSRGQLYGIT